MCSWDQFWGWGSVVAAPYSKFTFMDKDFVKKLIETIIEVLKKYEKKGYQVKELIDELKKIK